MPLAELIRYRPLGWDPEEMWLGMQYLRVREVGVFAQLRLVPPARRGWAIDGFASGGAGWETLRGDAEPRPSRDASRAARDALGVHGDEPHAGGPRAPVQPARGLARQRRAGVHGRRAGHASGPCACASPCRRAKDGLQRFDTWFTDTTAAEKTVVMPWNGFGRANARGVFVDVLKGPLPLTGIRSVTFIIGATGPGVLRIRRLALVPGHPQLGWPLHAATERRSLPPLQ